MAKQQYKKGVVTKTPATQPENLVVNQLNVISADRSKTDIGDLVTSLQSAESVHYPNRSRLYNLYDNILIDGHLTGIMSKRIDTVLNKNIHFSDANGKQVEALDELIKSLEFREVMRKILETPAYGISGMEFIPGAEFKFEILPRKHIKPNLEIIAFDQNGDEGISYKDHPFVWVTGQKNDLGYLLKCAPYAIWKRGNMADWAQYIEIFGQPVRIIYYDAYDEKTKIELKTVLDNTGSSLALMIPKQAQFEMKDGKQSNGNGELQEKFKKACDDEMSIVVLTNTETTNSSKGSGYAQAQTHANQQLEITKSDIKYVTALLNSNKFLQILKGYGYPVDGGKFIFEKEADTKAIKEQVDIIDIVKNKLGTPVEDDYIYELTGIPKPANYNQMVADKKAMEAVPVEPTSQPIESVNTKTTAENKKSNAQKPLKKTKQNLIDYIRTQLADFFDPAL